MYDNDIRSEIVIVFVPSGTGKVHVALSLGLAGAPERPLSTASTAALQQGHCNRLSFLLDVNNPKLEKCDLSSDDCANDTWILWIVRVTKKRIVDCLFVYLNLS